MLFSTPPSLRTPPLSHIRAQRRSTTHFLAFIVFYATRQNILTFSLAVSRSIAGCFCGAKYRVGGTKWRRGWISSKSIRLLFLTTCRGDRNVVADKRFIVNIQVCPHEFSTESICSFCSAFDLYYLWQKSDIGCDSAKKQMDLFFLLSSCTIFVPIKRV